MVFSSLSFLFFFLPCTALLYYICPARRWRNGVLLAASLLFYSWGEPRYVPVMLAAALVAWLGGLCMERGGRLRKPAFLLTVTLLLGNLFFFKYLGFAAENLGLLLGRELSAPAVVLPLGISFYTFQILSYVIDLYRGEVRVQRNFASLLLYVSFFPQLIAGPIVRYQSIENALQDRRESLERFCRGLERFVLGLGKKVLLANSAARLAETIYAGDPAVYGAGALWLAALAYTLQIYFDFSGYSDMAIGLGRIFGFDFPENFNYPYTALSITDFWRRWHISLSTWFRDYVYIPLGGNRVSRPRWILNLMIVWGLTGLWHGASWNFVLWGLYYGLLLAAEKLFLGRLLEKLPKLLRWALCFWVVMLGWVLFNLTDFSVLSDVLRRMFLLSPTDWAAMLADDLSLVKGVLVLPLGLACAMPLTRRLRRAEGLGPELLRMAGCLVILLLSLTMLFSTRYNPFIYFRF
ncbi:MAG: MBOAT family protein [Oscillospiraceae bacterium]|nr:MBOAT family protein [Oscillospiraceae bacterium]